MTGQVTSIACLPNDMLRHEIFQYFDATELGLAGQVSRSWHEHARQDGLWARFPEVAKEHRFTIHWISKEEWKEKGAARTEERLVEFLQRCPIKPSSKFEAVFSHDYNARLSLMIDDYTTTSFISDSEEHVLRESCFISCDEIAESGKPYLHTIGGNDGYLAKFEKPRYKELAERIYGCDNAASLYHDVLPMRQFIVSHSVTMGPFYKPLFDKDCFNRICEAAEDRIYELDERTVDEYVAAKRQEAAEVAIATTLAGVAANVGCTIS